MHRLSGFQVRIGDARFTSEDALTVDGQSLPANAYLNGQRGHPASVKTPGISQVQSENRVVSQSADRASTRPW